VSFSPSDVVMVDQSDDDRTAQVSARCSKSGMYLLYIRQHDRGLAGSQHARIGAAASAVVALADQGCSVDAPSLAVVPGPLPRATTLPRSSSTSRGRARNDEADGPTTVSAWARAACSGGVKATPTHCAFSVAGCGFARGCCYTRSAGAASVVSTRRCSCCSAP